MEGLAVFLSGLHGVDQGGVLLHIPLFRGLCDAGELLVHYPASADVGVAHFGVAHLPVRKAHVKARGAYFGDGVLL